MPFKNKTEILPRKCTITKNYINHHQADEEVLNRRCKACQRSSLPTIMGSYSIIFTPHSAPKHSLKVKTQAKTYIKTSVSEEAQTRDFM